ncbi:MAG: L,D-transpeptidase [Myxococcales bacterium]|nr:L,D-transpeptidase [Myxococcales bacterium]
MIFAPFVLLAAVTCGRGKPPGEEAGTAVAVPEAAVAETLAEVAVEADVAEAEVALVAPKHLLGARAQITPVFTEPKPGALKLGYLRAGAVVEREDKPEGDAGCKGGWYAIKPKGYVCVGDHATLDLDDPIVKYATRRPDRKAPLPYAYAIAKNTLSPFYARVPTKAESMKLEADLDTHWKWVSKPQPSDAGPEYDASVTSDGGVIPVWNDGPPDFLRDGKGVPNVSGLVKSGKALWAGRPKTKEGFAIVASFWSGPGGTTPTGGPDDRRFDLTTDYLLLPHDRLREVRPSTFHGIPLDATTTLPVAFVKNRYKAAKVWADGSKPQETLPSRTAVPITAATKHIDGALYLGTTDGAWVKADNVIKVEPPKSLPAFAAKGEKWIDVSIARQSIIAFDGDKPVYVSLVSTGRDGLGDPESSHATIRGVYRIHTKHVTATMDSDEVGEAFSLRDVPYVMYFETGYALHGAYWHDGFGEPRSHGCINLAEIDAAWFFAWTGPDVPETWHGAFARPMATGTPIWIHP